MQVHKGFSCLTYPQSKLGEKNVAFFLICFNVFFPLERSDFSLTFFTFSLTVSYCSEGLCES